MPGELNKISPGTYNYTESGQEYTLIMPDTFIDEINGADPRLRVAFIAFIGILISEGFPVESIPMYLNRYMASKPEGMPHNDYFDPQKFKQDITAHKVVEESRVAGGSTTPREGGGRRSKSKSKKRSKAGKGKSKRSKAGKGKKRSKRSKAGKRKRSKMKRSKMKRSNKKRSKRSKSS